MKNDPNAFPSLYARLVPRSSDAGGGFSVVCTATNREIGTVWWWSIGNHVTWSWREIDGAAFGDRSTKRGAVQALRDLQNGQWSLTEQLQSSLAARPDYDTRDREGDRTPPASAARPQVAAPAPAPAPVSQKIDWNARPRTDINIGDLTKQIAAALNRRK